jgi:hypothetical protein
MPDNLNQYLGLECSRVSIQALLDGLLPLFFVNQVVEAMIAVAIVAELAVCKTVTIP